MNIFKWFIKDDDIVSETDTNFLTLSNEKLRKELAYQKKKNSGYRAKIRTLKKKLAKFKSK